MPLKDMKLTKRQATREDSPEIGIVQPRYPHGLELRLDDEALKKLGITSLPAVGEGMKIVARGKVTSTRQSDRQSGSDRNVEIQIQKLEITPTKKSTAVDAVNDAIKD